MNKKYIKELFEENKNKFISSELDICSAEDLEDLMKDYIVSNMQFDFGIDIIEDKLFKGGK